MYNHCFLLIYTVLLHCYCGQLELCVLSQWRHDVYGILMSVFLFRLSSRGINLMNLSTEPVQLVLTLMYISSLMSHSCLGVYAHDTIFHACFWFEFIDTPVLVPARHLAFITSLVGEFLTPLDPHLQILKFGACGFSRLLIRDASWKCGSSADRLEFFFSGPPARLSSFLFITHEHLLYCLYLYISL